MCGANNINSNINSNNNNTNRDEWHFHRCFHDECPNERSAPPDNGCGNINT
jgi:hypothetical protein